MECAAGGAAGWPQVPAPARRRQVILDFYCAESRLCIEVDGEIHEKQRERDMVRDTCLFSHGIVTLRFSNGQVFDDLPGVLEAIKAAATHPRW